MFDIKTPRTDLLLAPWVRTPSFRVVKEGHDPRYLTTVHELPQATLLAVSTRFPSKVSYGNGPVGARFRVRVDRPGC